MDDAWAKEHLNGTVMIFMRYKSHFAGYIYSLQTDQSLLVKSDSRLLPHNEAEALFAEHLADELSSRVPREKTAGSSD